MTLPDSANLFCILYCVDTIFCCCYLGLNKMSNASCPHHAVIAILTFLTLCRKIKWVIMFSDALIVRRTKKRFLIKCRPFRLFSLIILTLQVFGGKKNEVVLFIESL